MRVNRKSLLQLSAVSLSAVLLLAACGGSPGQAGGAGGPGGMQMPPPEVTVVVIQKGALPISADLPGRVEALRTSDVRARVAGIIQKRAFREGSEVKAGELLYQIDPAPYRAALDSAQAQLAKAEATAANAKATEARASSLINGKLISQQDYDTAVASSRSAQADVLAAKASIETAKLNLGYATVTAPISGRIGRALVTEGALVGQGTDATQLATIQQLDSVYVNFSEPSAVVLKLRQAAEQGRLKGLANDTTPVSVILEDGSTYAHQGHLLFSDLSVDPGTGSVVLRGEVPNPDRLLLPGMFVNVRLSLGVAQEAITVPQRAVMRSPQGAFVYVVKDGKVTVQPIQTDLAQGDSWVVSSGLQGGEQVIVDGLQKVKPGGDAKAVTAEQAAAEAANPPQAAGK